MLSFGLSLSGAHLFAKLRQRPRMKETEFQLIL